MPSPGAKTFLTRPQNVPLRKALFQIHLWSGIAISLYIVIVATTGAVLVFRPDIERAIFPHLFAATAGEPADAGEVLERVAGAFPGRRIYWMEAPTRERPTTLASVEGVGSGEQLLLLDPVTTQILGELPKLPSLTTLHNLHASLIRGRTGRLVNGVASLLLLVMCATGVVIWWPGAAAWRSGFIVNFGRSWRRINWELHSAVGIWALALTAVWGVTGVYFTAPSQVHTLLNAIAPLNITVGPTSDAKAAATNRPGWRVLIARAQEHAPGQHAIRVTAPWDDRGSIVVVFAPTREAPVAPQGLTQVYLDQYTGEILKATVPADRSVGDRVIEWMGPLHIGTFGGLGVRIVWAAFGLAPAVLAVTGFIMWWLRVVRPRWPATRSTI